MDFLILEFNGTVSPEALVQVPIDKETDILQETLVVGATFMQRDLDSLARGLSRNPFGAMTESSIQDLLSKVNDSASQSTTKWFKDKFNLPTLGISVTFSPVDDTYQVGTVQVSVRADNPVENFYIN